jgi:hypothetical protein
MKNTKKYKMVEFSSQILSPFPEQSSLATSIYPKMDKTGAKHKQTVVQSN